MAPHWNNEERPSSEGFRWRLYDFEPDRNYWIASIEGWQIRLEQYGQNDFKTMIWEVRAKKGTSKIRMTATQPGDFVTSKATAFGLLDRLYDEIQNRRVQPQ